MPSLICGNSLRAPAALISVSVLGGAMAPSPAGAQDLVAFKGKWVNTNSPTKPGQARIGAWIEIDGGNPARIVFSWRAPSVMADAQGQWGANFVWRSETGSCWYKMERVGTKLTLALMKGEPPGECLEDSVFEGPRPPSAPKTERAEPPPSPPPSRKQNEPTRPSQGSLTQNTRPWNHNGSIVRLEFGGAAGAERRFYYESPREGLLREGVAPGTLLFKGMQVRDKFWGMAFVFSRACGPQSYQVSGRVSGDNRIVRMVGLAPRVNEACQVIDYQRDTLVFEYLGR